MGLFFLIRLTQAITSGKVIAGPSVLATVPAEIFFPATTEFVRLTGCIVLLLVLLMQLRQHRD
jgi:hypothetical protein